MNAQLSSLTQEYQSEHSQLKQLVHSKQRIDSQLAENESVQEQLTHIKKEDQSASTVFKSIGHVLIKQEFSESLSNVNRRIHFLKNEQSKVDKKIDSIQANIERLRPIIAELQANTQQEAPTQQLAQTHLAASAPAPTATI